MPKVLIKRATMAGGKRVDAGQTVTVSEKDARDLIALGKAVPAGDNAPPVENRDQDKAAGTTKRATTKKKTDD